MQLCVPLLSEDINTVPDFIMLTKIHPISSLLVSFLSQVEIASLEEEESVSEREIREQGDINYFVRPTPSDLQRFLDYHPQQNTRHLAVQEVLICKDGTSRKWLTYCERRHALFRVYGVWED